MELKPSSITSISIKILNERAVLTATVAVPSLPYEPAAATLARPSPCRVGALGYHCHCAIGAVAVHVQGPRSLRCVVVWPVCLCARCVALCLFALVSVSCVWCFYFNSANPNSPFTTHHGHGPWAGALVLVFFRFPLLFFNVQWPLHTQHFSSLVFFFNAPIRNSAGSYYPHSHSPIPIPIDFGLCLFISVLFCCYPSSVLIILSMSAGRGWGGLDSKIRETLA